ncbi:MAG TPA: FtsX-like permease family protein [Flavisolibacter sp.]|nr:FtsX-like permease family protein [Flavisolibacter sp.]
MLKNYFTIAWRSMMKNKAFSFINIFGLSAGLACCMLISFYILDETSYDRYHKHAKQIYQIGTTFIRNGNEKSKLPNTPAPMAETMRQEFPEIQGTARLMRLFAEDKTLLQSARGGTVNSFYEMKGYMADSGFFRLFSYQFVEGTAATALDEPNTIVLSEDVAKKLFGGRPALDQVIRVSSSSNGDHDCKVTGVFKPSQQPSHIDARFFLSIKGGDIEDYIKTRATSLATNNMFYTYLLLRRGTNPRSLEAKFPAFIDKYAGKDLKEMGFGKEQFLVALEDIHMRSGMKENVTAPGSVTYLYILGSIAVFILLIACINFMNLSTARSSKRSAEVGIRKVMGAERGALIGQFLGESVIMSLAAFFFALLIIWAALPAFNEIAGKNMIISVEDDGKMFAAFFALALLTGLVAGIYPAFYLSSFQPVKVLKGRFTNSLAAVSLRKGLVVFQFTISVLLIIASGVIGHQMNYLRSADLGFDKDRQIILPLRSKSAKSAYASLKNELSRLAGISSVGASLWYPGIFNPTDMPLYKEGQTMEDSRRVKMNTIDDGFLPSLGIKPVAGRLFYKDFPADTANRLVLNEEAVREMGFASPQDAIGKKTFVDFQGQHYSLDIIGVVRNFHFENFHAAITPFGFQLNNDSRYNYLIAHAKPGDMAVLLTSIDRIWKKLNPNEPFEYDFLDENFQNTYKAESKLMAVVTDFTVIAILISCLGLFGLATFSVEQRRKEIGVRKVLGATSGNILGLLSTRFLKLVSVSIVLATPIAWFIMSKWLEDFVYRVSIGWWVFVLAAVTALLIAFLTISLQAFRASNSNPVKNLRTE